MRKKIIVEGVAVFLKIFLVSFVVSLLIQSAQFLYNYGYYSGYLRGQLQMKSSYEQVISDLAENSKPAEVTPTIIMKKIIITPTPVQTKSIGRSVDWGGPELWEAVNKKRQEYGVNPLRQADELCTIASIRLNELLALGTLDGHEGFSNMTERREDLKWIFEKYSNLSEFLAAGAGSAEETVNLWDNTLAHKKLLTGGEYVWGCIYAQSSFAVALAAY